MVITLDPRSHHYSRSVMVNVNNIFGVKCSARLMLHVLAPRIKQETKSAFVHEENIVPLLVSPVCMLTISSISIAFASWDQWNTFHKFVGIQANFTQALGYGLLQNCLSSACVKLFCHLASSEAADSFHCYSHKLVALICVVYHCYTSWYLIQFQSIVSTSMLLRFWELQTHTQHPI